MPLQIDIDVRSNVATAVGANKWKAATWADRERMLVEHRPLSMRALPSSEPMKGERVWLYHGTSEETVPKIIAQVQLCGLFLQCIP